MLHLKSRDDAKVKNTFSIFKVQLGYFSQIQVKNQFWVPFRAIKAYTIVKIHVIHQPKSARDPARNQSP